MSKKKSNSSAGSDLFFGSYKDRLKPILKGLFYISETDSEVVPFEINEKGPIVDQLIEGTGADDVKLVEQVNADTFFERLSGVQDWYGEFEKIRAARFAEVYRILKAGLSDLTVYRVGRVRIEIFVVGRTVGGTLAGIKMISVET